MKYSIIVLFLLSVKLSFCQVRQVKEYYNNGQLKLSGKTYTFLTYENKVFCTTASAITKKIGSWKYYYNNGQLKKVEHYAKIKDCNYNGTPEGEWKYWSEDGKITRVDIYKEGNLLTGDISEIYLDTIPSGKIRMNQGKYDTILYENYKPDKSQLIHNNGFELYFGKPIVEFQDGQKHIEENIPFWSSANNSTADYYNPFRKLVRVPDNLPSEIENKEDSYVGIILYHDPSKTYSEYITGEFSSSLKAGVNYCLKIRIRLSQNSGFKLNRLGIYFSETKPVISNTVKEQNLKPQLIFNQDLAGREDWTMLCDSFTAKGNEKFITLGRFSSIAGTTIKPLNPIGHSEGEYNQSAYYLLDFIDLSENQSMNCSYLPLIPGPKIIDNNLRIDFDSIEFNTELNADSDKIFNLNNIRFEFDKSILLPVSLTELEKLKKFLVFHSGLSILILGHTDNIGKDEYNYTLSLSRAKAVYNWLVKNGIDAGRLQFEAFGSKKPLVDNSSAENRFINRRVEFKLLKK